MCKGGNENLPCSYLKKNPTDKISQTIHIMPSEHIFCQASQGAWLTQRCDFEEPFQAGCSRAGQGRSPCPGCHYQTSPSLGVSEKRKMLLEGLPRWRKPQLTPLSWWEQDLEWERADGKKKNQTWVAQSWERELLCSGQPQGQSDCSILPAVLILISAPAQQQVLG